MNNIDRFIEYKYNLLFFQFFESVNEEGVGQLILVTM